MTTFTSVSVTIHHSVHKSVFSQSMRHLISIQASSLSVHARVSRWLAQWLIHCKANIQVGVQIRLMICVCGMFPSTSLTHSCLIPSSPLRRPVQSMAHPFQSPVTHWLTDWLTLVSSLTVHCVARSNLWLIPSSPQSLTDWLTHSLLSHPLQSIALPGPIYGSTLPVLNHSLTHSLTHSLNSLTHSLTLVSSLTVHSVVRSNLWLNPSSPQSLPVSLTHSCLIPYSP